MNRVNKKKRMSFTMKMILSLLLVVILLISTITFAWFRNIITIDGAVMSTGQFKYDFEGFYKTQNGAIVSDFAYSTEDREGFDKITAEEKMKDPVVSESTFEVSVNNSGEIYYVVSKLDESVDLNVLLRVKVMKGDNIVSLNDFIGGFWYQISVESCGSEVNGESFVPISDDGNGSRILNQSAINIFETLDPSKNVPLQNIANNAYEQDLEGDSKYCIIRLTYGLNDTSKSGEYLSDSNGNPVTIRFVPELYVEQVGIPKDGDNLTYTHSVDSLSSLQEVVTTYNSGDTVIIKANIVYDGDLIFSRPVTLQIAPNASLEVRGKVMFSYYGTSGHDFKLDTTYGNLRISEVEVDGEKIGGDFIIDTPYSGFYLVGNADQDLVVPKDKDFGVNVSYEKGLYLQHFSAYDEYGELRAIYLRNEASVVVDRNSIIGELSVKNAPLYRVRISNYGSVEDIDLSIMSVTENATFEYDMPQILIENHNTITNAIALPSGSELYDEDEKTGNTEIIWHQGGGDTIVAESPVHNFTNDDITREEKTNLIEKLNGSDNEILVHYMRGWSDEETPTLESIITKFVTHTNPELKIVEATQIKSMTVVCYEGITLSAADYAFIRSMSSLTTLDLSDADSEGGKVPDQAFLNMQTLTTVTMPFKDTAWGTYIFNGTNVTDITLPLNVTSIQSTTFTKKVGNTEEYVKYIHINSSGAPISGIPKSSYIFLPDDNVRNLYVSASYFRAFVESTRYSTQYGDFFLRYINDGYELVTYADSNTDWYRVFDPTPDNITVEGKGTYLRLDMSVIDVGSQKLDITSIGPYAFYDVPALRSTDENSNKFYLMLGDGVASIGEYAFYNASALLVIEGHGVTYCANYAIRNCNSLQKVIFPKMTSIGINNQPFIDTCGELFWLETGIVNKKINNSSCTNIATNVANLTIYLVHENPNDNFEDMSAVGNKTGSSKMYRFVSSNISSLYTSSGVNQSINIGTLTLSDLNFYPIVSDNDIYSVPKFVGAVRSEGEEIIVCTRTSLEAEDVFTSFPTNVNRIGDYAFSYLSIYSNTETASLTFPDNVTYVGHSAFKGSDKNYHSLNLNNVEIAGQSAFASNKMLFAYGPNLHSLGDYAFNAATMYYVELPEWRYSYGPAMNYGYYFWQCSNLRYAYLGPLDNIRNWAFYQCSSLSCVFIDAEGRASGAGAVPFLGWYTSNTERFIAIVSGGKSVVDTGYEAKSKEVIVNSFEDFIYADFTSESVSVGSVRGELILPQSVCVREENNTITYVKSMKKTLEGNYVTPGNVYKLAETVQFLGKTVNAYTVDPTLGGTEDGTITKIGVNAYFGVTFSGTATITISPNVITLGNYAFRECKAAEVNLNRVQTIGSYCFLNAINLQVLKSDYVQVLNGYAFSGCTVLKVISLPSFVSSNGTAPFYYSGVESITLGKSTQNLGTSMFQYCKDLISVTIQSPTVPAATTPFSTGSGNNATVLANIALSVQKSADYLPGGAADWNNLPAAQINFFGNITVIDGVEFYWDIVNQTNKTIEIVMIRFTENWTDNNNGAFVIPSTLTETVSNGETDEDVVYYVIGINEASIIAIKNQFSYTSLTLPYGLQIIEFSQTSLSTALKEFKIPEAPEGFANECLFAVEDGVLYNKEKTVLIFYPSAKETTDFVVPSTVMTISPNAFYSARFVSVEINQQVVIMDQAFADCVSLTTITFTSENASIFAGRDIFSGNIALTKIYVPEGKLSAYSNNVFYEKSIISIMEELVSAE